MTTVERPDQLPPEISEDTFFFDHDYARMIAEQGNLVASDGGERLQLCYSNNLGREDDPINLVSAPVSMFVELFGQSTLPLPTFVHASISATEVERRELQQAFHTMLDDVRGYRASLAEDPAPPAHKDGYYFDIRQAFLAAVQRRPVSLGHPTIFGLQVCYFDGEPFPGMPENLVPLPCEQVGEFFASTRLRAPQELVFPDAAADDLRQQLAQVFKSLLDQADAARNAQFQRLQQQAMTLAPQGCREKRRIFLPTSRLTQVMQYASKGLANAFRQLGHEAYVSIEHSAMEHNTLDRQLADFVESNPDLVININHLNNQWLHPDVYNVAWWQDPMPEITQGDPLRLRNRDLIFSATGEIDGYLETKGVNNVLRQGFCVDTSIFHCEAGKERQPKVVFAGSSYRRRLRQDEDANRLLGWLVQQVQAGVYLTRQEVEQAADHHRVDHHHAFWDLWHFVTRDLVVQWLCQSAETLGLEVDVYGRYWQDDPIVSKYFRGEVSHGAALAEIYASAKYALVCHPFDLNSQRLAEAAACGCTPLVFDCRKGSDAPHWTDQECLYFTSQQQLDDLLKSGMTTEPSRIAELSSYRHFANRLLEITSE